VLYGCNKPVAASRDSFNESWRIRIVIENRTNSANAEIQPLLEVHKCGPLPDLISQFLSGDQLARIRYKGGQNLEGLSLKPDGVATFS
jgi:hypothetical protein